MTLDLARVEAWPALPSLGPKAIAFGAVIQHCDVSDFN
jgi:hypothetical protein